ncbi:hypothetical protein [Paracidovorax anthurii]|uniref:Uncharacterized protein n=1 Tax=Paracidovorax anthurii TaxID=78229 RepID=A0A328YRV1_9BURK|nr:hypothetical protein [Paracidovorax anthurii]RAR76420.1 hypothetical protein AX018_104818 [Paracidovorax anthurii]
MAPEPVAHRRPRSGPGEESHPALRRRTDTGYVAGADRPGRASVAGLRRSHEGPDLDDRPVSRQRTEAPAPKVDMPPPPPYLGPGLMQDLSSRADEAALVVMGLRHGAFDLRTAERELPGLSRLVLPNGDWRPIDEILHNVASAASPEEVFRVVGRIASMVSAAEADQPVYRAG